jgi:hypothetical protein
MRAGRGGRTVVPMTRSAAFALVFEAVMPALGIALLLGASAAPAFALAALATLAIFAVAR